MKSFVIVILATCLSCTGRISHQEGATILPVTSDEQKQALFDLANKHYEEEDYENAILLYDTLAKLIPSDGEVFFKKGYSEAQTNNFTQSTEDFKKSADLGYRIAESYYNAGLNQMIVDNDSTSGNDDLTFHEAIELFEKCLRSNPDKETSKSATEFIRVLRKRNEVNG